MHAVDQEDHGTRASEGDTRAWTPRRGYTGQKEMEIVFGKAALAVVNFC